MRKVISIITVLSLLIVFAVGCKKSGESLPGESNAKPTEEIKREEALVSSKPITLKVMAPSNAYQGPWEEYTVFKNLEKITNIHFEFETASEGWAEKKNLALATGDLPDIFLDGISKSDEDTYGPQGVFLKINEYIDDYGPNIKKAFEKYPLLKKAVTAIDGNIYALGMVTYTMTQGDWKMHINKKWLDNLNLKVPETVEDFYNVLVAFSKYDANAIPMTDNGFERMNGWLMPAFGETYGRGDGRVLSIKDGKVVFTRASEGYKQYLMFLRKLYKEKLLDNTFISQTGEEYIAKTKTNLCGVLAHPGQADWTQYQVLPPLTSAFNNKKIATAIDRYTTGHFAITRNNKYPVESVKWADIFHRDPDNAVEGFSGVSFWVGQQGVDWDYVDASKTAYKYLFKPEGDLSEWLTFLKRKAYGGGIGVRVLMAAPAGDYMKWVADGNRLYSYPYQDESRLFPLNIRYTKEEADQLSILGTDIHKYVSEMQAKFVVGEESFDNWDNYVNVLYNQLKLNKFIEIQQAAFDRYNR
ncbi:MAG: extracellular solute-binding protein [Firmicutes bacterium]|nr:extracellular solute-binding protein [Bacillota bacterium]